MPLIAVAPQRRAGRAIGLLARAGNGTVAGEVLVQRGRPGGQ